MYDIIGDIHGHADPLEALLEKLGYSLVGGVYRHATRQVVFVGDFIDRGPRQRDTLAIVRAMVEAGTAQAVMGNHEFNAIAYHTRHPVDDSEFLRPRSEKNVIQHAATVAQLSAYELADALDWFRTLPMWLDLDDLRVVHACWDPVGIETIKTRRNVHGGVTDAFMAEALDKSTGLYEAVEHVLKGPEMPLPRGCSYRDKEGTEREEIRVRWFADSTGIDLGEYAIPTIAERLGKLPDDFTPPVSVYGRDEPPVFFGHYWLTGTPAPQTENVACLDYSVAKKGPLCAYRWDGERKLETGRFVCVCNSSD